MHRMWRNLAYGSGRVFHHEICLWRHNDVFRDKKRVIAPHALSKKNYYFDFMQRCPCSCANTLIFHGFKMLLILTIYGHLAVNWFSLISCNFTPFYPIEMGFSVEILFLRSKNVCKVLNTVFQIFNVVTKIGVTYDVILSRNVKNTFTMVKI